MSAGARVIACEVGACECGREGVCECMCGSASVVSVSVSVSVSVNACKQGSDPALTQHSDTLARTLKHLKNP